ncbi:MAG: D-alanyl-D-alanine carboxypeptidase DacB [Acidimicrobiia bacterium]|nr:MAG: D-alanyl-D-alanine carboxypeptidase DacB [Acidimicrobiia bacterium]
MFTTAFVSFALVATLLGTPHASAPVTALDAPEIPKLTAERWITYDADADVVLASWNANDRSSMASVTKVMTAMIVLDNADLGTIVTIPSFATGARGSVAGLVTGEQWTVGDLLIAMLVRSGNDAALTLAYHVGGESISSFVDMMNAEASGLGMTNTRFANPNGLDADEHYSTARDLLTLIIASQEYPDIQRISRIKLVSMPADPNGKARTFKNTNKLLGSYPGVTGLKTGDTPWADKVLLATSERAGRRIYSVVLHSDDHFMDTRELLEWSYRTYSIRDRWLRPLFSEDGGGATVSVTTQLTESEQRRLRALPPLPDGRWNTSSLEDLPKAESIGRWIREAIPNVATGD